jgi:hypothetical protein
MIALVNAMGKASSLRQPLNRRAYVDKGRGGRVRYTKTPSQMSASGHKRTLQRVSRMSPKADIKTQPLNDRFVPFPDSCTAKNAKRPYFHKSSTFFWHGRASVKKKEAQPEAGLSF